MRAVNLLPPELRPGNRWATMVRRAPARRVLAASGVAAGVVALGMGGLAFHARSVVDDRQASLRAAQARLVAAQAKAAAVQEARAASEARLAAVRDVVTRRVVWEDVLHDLSRVLPANVWLQSLAVSSPAAGAAGTPSGFTVTGSADSQNRVAEVLDRLALLPWLGEVTLQSSTRGGNEVQFAIGATLRSTGGR